MSEESTTTQTPAAPAAPAINMDAIRAEAAREAEAKATALFSQKEEALTEKIKTSIVEAISGKPKEPELDPTVQKLLTDPETVLGHVARSAVQDALAEFDRKQELRQVVSQTFNSRADLKDDPIAQRAIGSFYAEVQKQNPDMDNRSAFAEAVKMYDKERGTTTTQATPPAHTAISSGGSPAPSESTPGNKSEDDLLREEMQSNLERQNKKRHGFSM